MQHLIEAVIEAIGWFLLKLVTAGRYKRSGSSSVLAEGAVGLAVIGVTLWVAYRWWALD